MDWVKKYATRWGPRGITGLIALLFTLQNVGMLPAAHEIRKNGKGNELATAEQLREHDKNHTEQMAKQEIHLNTVVEQLRLNRETQATGLRTLCVISARTETQQLKCAEIK